MRASLGFGGLFSGSEAVCVCLIGSQTGILVHLLDCVHESVCVLILFDDFLKITGYQTFWTL